MATYQKYLLGLILLLLGPFCEASIGVAPPGILGLRWGMSLTEVRTAMGDRILDEQLSQAGRGESPGEACTWLSLKPVQMAGRTCKVSLWGGQNQGLFDIEFSAKVAGADDGQELYKQLCQLAGREYGAYHREEVYYVANGGAGYRREWTYPRTYMKVDVCDRQMSILYRQLDVHRRWEARMDVLRQTWLKEHEASKRN